MFYIVDKPIGPSSNQALTQMRRFLWAKKAGYVGTLDPLASGLLLVATDESTRLIPYVSESSKTYEFTFDITATSDSLDLGTPLQNVDLELFETLRSNITKDHIVETLKKYTGSIEQVPPSYSAIWIDGKRSYRVARRNSYNSPEMELPPLKARSVIVESLELREFEFPIIKAAATVSSGTYVRSLARDIAMDLGGQGVVTELRRTAAEGFELPHSFDTKFTSKQWETIGFVAVSDREVLPECASISLSVEQAQTLRRWNIPKIPLWWGGQYALAYLDHQLVSLLQKTDAGTIIIERNLE